MNTPALACEIVSRFVGQRVRLAGGEDIRVTVKRGRATSTATVVGAMQLSRVMLRLQVDAAEHPSDYKYFGRNIINVPAAMAVGCEMAVERILRSSRGECAHCGTQPGPRFFEVALVVVVASPPRIRLEMDAVSQTDLKVCSGCGTVSYCGSACQRAHWAAGHRSSCAVLASIRTHTLAAVSAQEAAALIRLPHAMYVRCMLPFMAADSGDSLATSRENLTRSMSHLIDTSRCTIDFYMSQMAISDITKGPTLSTPLSHGVVNEINVLRVYSPTTSFVDTGDRVNVDDLGHLAPESRLTHIPWTIRQQHAAAFNSEMRRMLDTLESEDRRVSTADENLRILMLQMRVKRARGFTHVLVVSIADGCGVWFALEQSLLVRRMRRYRPAEHARLKDALLGGAEPPMVQ